MPRRYLVALVDGGGNVPPELAVVRRLVQRGHRVTVLADDSVAADVDATGAKRRSWRRAPNRPDRRPEHDPARDWECRYPWQLVDRLTKTLFVGPAAHYADDVDAAIAEGRPDLVITSMFCLGSMIAAEAAVIPFDVLFPNIYLLPARGLPPVGLGLQPARSPLGWLRDRAINAVSQRLWDSKGLTGLNAVRVARRLEPVRHVFDQIRRARRHLVLTSRAFEFPAMLPANVRYVGPVLDDPHWAMNVSWTPPHGDMPLVVVAMSTTFQDQVGCLQRVIDALATLPVRGFVTTGPAVEPASLAGAPRVAIVAKAPHREVLRHASVVVTHAGHGTVTKALAAGVPLVMLPHGRDQDDTAARVTARHAGIAVARTATTDVIARAIQRVLQHDSYRTAARPLGEAIVRESNSNALITELENIRMER